MSHIINVKEGTMAKKHEHKTHKQPKQMTEEELLEWAAFLYNHYQAYKKNQKNDVSIRQISK